MALIQPEYQQEGAEVLVAEAPNQKRRTLVTSQDYSSASLYYETKEIIQAYLQLTQDKLYNTRLVTGYIKFWCSQELKGGLRTLVINLLISIPQQEL